MRAFLHLLQGIGIICAVIATGFVFHASRIAEERPENESARPQADEFKELDAQTETRALRAHAFAATFFFFAALLLLLAFILHEFQPLH